MIIVVGPLVIRGAGTEAVPDGLAGRIALAAAHAGSDVEVVARIGTDPAGDELLLALARAGVGHVAVLRDSVHATPRLPDPDDEVTPDEAERVPAATATTDLALDGADVGLALRYLTDYRVVVAVHPGPEALAAATGASTWAGAHLVVVAGTDGPQPVDLPPGALVVASGDPAEGSGAVGDLLGAYAAAIDRGDDPAAAYAAMTSVPGSV